MIFGAIGSLIPQDPEQRYQEFKRKLDSMKKEDRETELQRIQSFYFLTPINRWVGRYDRPNWDTLREERDRMQEFYRRYLRETGQSR